MTFRRPLALRDIFISLEIKGSISEGTIADIVRRMSLDQEIVKSLLLQIMLTYILFEPFPYFLQGC